MPEPAAPTASTATGAILVTSQRRISLVGLGPCRGEGRGPGWDGRLGPLGLRRGLCPSSTLGVRDIGHILR